MGFRDFEIFNLVLLAKQAWRLLINPNTLVSKILKAKYFPRTGVMQATSHPTCPFAWQSILEGLDLLKQGVSFTDWVNSPRWVGDSSGVFTVKSGYTFFLSIKKWLLSMGGEASDQSHAKKFWTYFWKLDLPNKIKIFDWKLYYNGIPCTENLFKRGCTVDLHCWCFGARIVSSLHIFRDCWSARDFLAKLGNNEVIFSLDCNYPGYWLWICASLLSRDQFKRLLCGLWFLWFRRNLAIHGKS